MFYKGRAVVVVGESNGLHNRKVVYEGDEDYDGFWVKHTDIDSVVLPSRNTCISVIVPQEIPEEMLARLKNSGVSIRIMAAPEHLLSLKQQLSSVGADMPIGFECIAVGELGGVTRPWAPQYEVIFADENGNEVRKGSTSLALGLIQAGFPITEWKGKNDGKIESL